jgi:hypothetical protein
MAVILFDGKVVERLAFGLWTGVHIVNTMNERHGKEVWSCPLAFPPKACRSQRLMESPLTNTGRCRARQEGDRPHLGQIVLRVSDP